MNLSTEPQKIESQKSIDNYLGALRKHLWELTPEDANDIVEEIRMHILDKTGQDATAHTVAATLLALGTPADLAAKYCTQQMLARGRAAHSPTYMARSLTRWALLALGAIVAILVSVVGYGIGGFLFMLGLLKLFQPAKTGVYGTWTAHDSSLRWQSGGTNTPDELLGWWLVPIGLIVGGVLLLLTFKFGNWSIRKFWRPRSSQEI